MPKSSSTGSTVGVNAKQFSSAAGLYRVKSGKL